MHPHPLRRSQAMRTCSGGHAHVARAALLIGVVFLAGVGCASGRPYGRATLVEGSAQPRTVHITATTRGFDPPRVQVTVGETVRFVFRRVTERKSMDRVQIWLAEGETISRPLLVHQPVAIVLRFDEAGELGYTCGGMDHGGAIDVQDAREGTDAVPPAPGRQK